MQFPINVTDYGWVAIYFQVNYEAIVCRRWQKLLKSSEEEDSGNSEGPSKRLESRFKLVLFTIMYLPGLQVN